MFVNFAPQKLKIGRIGERAGPARHVQPHVNISVAMADVNVTLIRRRRPKRHTDRETSRGVWT